MCTSSKLLSQFEEANRLLESVQKGMSDYLETKRLAFARFFFLSNDELLQILSQAQVCVQLMMVAPSSTSAHSH